MDKNLFENVIWMSFTLIFISILGYFIYYYIKHIINYNVLIYCRKDLNKSEFLKIEKRKVNLEKDFNIDIKLVRRIGNYCAIDESGDCCYIVSSIGDFYYNSTNINEELKDKLILFRKLDRYYLVRFEKFSNNFKNVIVKSIIDEKNVTVDYDDVIYYVMDTIIKKKKEEED